MIKLLGAAIIISGAAGIGQLCCKEAEEWIRHLQMLNRMLDYLRGEIKCYQASLPDAAISVSRRLEAPYSIFLEQLSQTIENKAGEGFGEIWSRLARECFCGIRWKRKEFMEFSRLGERLGYLDSQMQLTIIEQYEKQLSGTIEELAGALKEQKKMYHSLGIAGGLFLVILFI